MTLIQWFIFFLAVQVMHFLGTWKLYEKAGKSKWTALIPIYNGMVWMDVIKRPRWWIALLFVPVINIFIFMIIWAESMSTFKHDDFKSKALAIVTLGFYIFTINYNDKTEYRPITKKNDDTLLASLIFAVVVATMVHTYVMQPYAIPTPSLEKSLLVGDYLLVSKFHYGAKTPSTPLAFPMVHDTLPFLGKSYLSKPQLPKFRFPGFQKIKNNDIVVFHWPADTVYFFRDPSGRHIDKPLDKRSNYVKRCVAIAGDELEIKDGDIYINGELSIMPDRTDLQYMYEVKTKDKRPLSKSFFKKHNITEGGMLSDGHYILNLTKPKFEKLKKNKNLTLVKKKIDPKGIYNKAIFPHDAHYKWSKDNFGPLTIPKKGVTVTLNKTTLPLYKRLIEVYEDNDVQLDGETVLVNGQSADSYTFNQDYYWMMGDNRHNSEDSRYWGFVPMDHVVGKPVFIFWSWDMTKPFGEKIKTIRWDRIMSTVGGDGKRVSYRYWVFGAIFLYIGYGYYKKKKDKA